MRKKLVLLVLLTACQFITPYRYQVRGNYIKSASPDEYIHQLTLIANDYKNSNISNTCKLSRSSLNYLKSSYKLLSSNNDLILKQDIPEFTIIKDASPFIIAIESKIFISTGILGKYLRQEEIFLAALIQATIRSTHNLFYPKRIIPTGNITTKKLLELNQLDLISKTKINELAFYVLERIGLHPSVYLLWLQTIGKNVFDFQPFLGDINHIGQEEYLFKQFMATHEYGKDIAKKVSPLFYKLIEEINKC